MTLGIFFTPWTILTFNSQSLELAILLEVAPCKPFYNSSVMSSFILMSTLTETLSTHFRCHAAMMQPDAFVATIFIEPILFQMKEQTEGLAKKTLRRRDRWESK